MPSDKMLRMARAYWAEGEAADGWDPGTNILHGEDTSEVPELLQALVDTCPEGRLNEIGTGPIETLQMALEFGWRKKPATMELLLAAKPTPTEIFEILSGAWPSYMAELDIELWLDGILTVEQIQWLSDPGAEGRRVPL